MAYACEICGKGKQFGHNVPFSQKKTNKVWKPNLQRTRIEIDGTRVRVKMCTQCMRTLAKYEREALAKVEKQKQTVEPKPSANEPKAKTPKKVATSKV
jgi:large subunit ribosomal protein L28